MVDKVMKMIGKPINPFKNVLKDTDNDKVINVVDCEPYNSKRQGVLHKLGSFAKEKYREKKEEFLEDREVNKDIRKKARAETFRAREEEMVSEARQKEKIASQRRVQKFKDKSRSPGLMLGTYKFTSSAFTGLGGRAGITSARKTRTKKGGGKKKTTKVRKTTTTFTSRTKPKVRKTTTTFTSRTKPKSRPKDFDSGPSIMNLRI